MCPAEVQSRGHTRRVHAHGRLRPRRYVGSGPRSHVPDTDTGSSYPQDHKYAREGSPIGAAIWRSPEALFKRPWDVKTDIWSFGTLVYNLI